MSGRFFPMMRKAVGRAMTGALVAVAGLAEADQTPQGVLVEAESFADCGGWTLDQQFLDQMGSSFLLAHGIGKPVADAVTRVAMTSGRWRLWVRTRDWCRPETDGPGAFSVKVNGQGLGTFGVGGSGEWEWVRGPTVEVRDGSAEIRLVDLTGFEGRVDALFFGRGGMRPPETWSERRQLLALGKPNEVKVDFVVVGGGMAGLCAAVTAAREGLSVALVQDRAVFGGNASNEVRIHVLGSVGQGPYPHNGDVLKEILRFADGSRRSSACDNWRIDDRRLNSFLSSQKGLSLYALTRVVKVEKRNGSSIAAVIGRHVVTGAETRFSARYFLDATGDAAVAFAAGAECRCRPEMKSETGERLAPDGNRQGGDYGSSVYWFTREAELPCSFPPCPWALAVNRPEDALLGDEVKWRPTCNWNWETGFGEDNVRDGERIRDRLFRAIYGTWDYTKNKRPDCGRFARSEIFWMGHVLGKRAARRVIGDYVLTERDLEEHVIHPDGVVTTDWYLDLHFPHPVVERTFGRNVFRSTAYDATRAEDRVDSTRFVGEKVAIRPYEIPYRCLYAKAVDNLFLAGKDISATHVAMGSHRVMNTGGAMGAVVARAAALCKTGGLKPRDLSAGDGLERLKAKLATPVRSWLPEGFPYRPYSRNGRFMVEPVEAGWRIVHDGSQDWALALSEGPKAQSGETFRLTCPCRTISRQTGEGVALSVIVRDAKGRTLLWHFARTRLVAGETAQVEFAVPPGGAVVQARIEGSGEAEFEVGSLSLVRTGRLGRADALPDRWTLESAALKVDVASADLSLAITDRRTGRIWRTETNAACGWGFVRGFQVTPTALRLDVADAATLETRKVAIELDGTAPSEFSVTLSGEGIMRGSLDMPGPLGARKGDWMILPVSEGLRLPIGEKTIPLWRPALWSSEMSMPFFGVEGACGAGWMAIAERRDDVRLNVLNRNGAPSALGPSWVAERGRFGYARKVRYVFFESGGYVAMAKRYRRHAAATGLVRTFRDKARSRPNVVRLPGSANVWFCGGKPALDVAGELLSAGIDRFLWSAGGDAKTVARLSEMPGVLVSRYDSYRDIYTPELMRQLGKTPNSKDEIGRNTSAWPQAAIWNSADSNDVRRAWGVICKDGVKRHCAAQCTLCQVSLARKHTAEELKTHPYNARFVDVTTAVGAEECENPAHPMTRSQSREAGAELLGTIGREFGLVVGSEQGVDWAVPVCDYFEGMLSPAVCRMPHGRPGADRGDIFREGLDPTNVTPAEVSRVLTYGLGEKYRIPLFELVYHDCCCAHWYWYDYSNRPLRFWRKRDLFNVLYGTAPMYVFDYRLWQERKDLFAESYRMTTEVARRTGFSEMLDHRALTEDRSVQQTVFADGTVVTVNFGDCPAPASSGMDLAPLSFRVTAAGEKSER